MLVENKHLEAVKRWQKLHPDKVKDFYKNIKSNKPWVLTLQFIKQRCLNSNREGFHRYGGRGIKCLIIESELKELWFRDKAYLMDHPTIDREDNDGDYAFENCRYIENIVNCKKNHIKPILQYNLNKELIKEWNSISEASRSTDIAVTHISRNAKGKTRQTHGFIWKYIE